MEIRRVFHPVGQGAFYSETHSRRDDSGEENIYFRAVYDCGTTTNLKNYNLQQRIEDWLTNANVDVCFISHLDEDHCNGVQFLNPQVIILPLVKEWDRAIFWLSNQLGYSNFNVNIKEYLKSKAPDAKIVEVEGFRPDIDDINSEELQHNVIDVNDLSRDLIRSGTRISTSSHGGDDSINWITRVY